MTHFIFLLLFIAVIALIDYVVRIRALFADKINLADYSNTSQNYTIIIPIFGRISYLKNLDYIKRYRNKVILLTSEFESKSFNQALDRRKSKYGFRVVRLPVKVRQSGINNPWVLVRELFRNHRKLITTKYTLIMDADTYPEKNISKLVGVMQKLDYDIASLGVLADKQDNLIEKLQQIEYRSSLRSHYIYPSSVSGAAMIGKTGKIARIFKSHSGFPNGGDLERGMLASAMKMKIGFIPFNFYTEVPATFKSWFRQRSFWFAGGFRRNVVNMHFYKHDKPFYFFYNTILIYLFLPIRWTFVVLHLSILPLVISIYWIYAFIYYRKSWEPYYLAYPIYALVQVLVLVPIGAFNYFKRAIVLKNPGVIAIRDKASVTRLRQSPRFITNIVLMFSLQVLTIIGSFYIYATSL